MLDYRINTFLTLYDEMNYRKTAQKLNMTQPGVTQHIHHLEAHYGVKLFEYDGKALTKTKNAELLKRYFNSVRTEEVAVRGLFKHNDCLTLRVGATKTVGEFVLPPSVETFLSNTAHRLELIVDNTENLLSKLERAELDFAIIEGVFDKTKYGYHLFKKEAFVGICATDHPFANKSVSLSEIFNQSIVIREKGSGTRRLLEQAISDCGFSLEQFKRCTTISNFSLICNLVANNKAITFAYAPVAASSKRLATFEIDDLQINGEFNFVYCNQPTANEKIKIFIP